MAKRTTFEVSIRLYQRPSTGESWIIRDKDWFEDQKKRIEENAENLITQENIRIPKSDEDKEVRRQELLTLPLKLLAEQQARHEALRDTVEPTAFRLSKPTHGQNLKAKEAAKVTHPLSGETRYDIEKWQEALISEPGAVIDEDGESVKINDLDPVVVPELSYYLWRSVTPDESRLPNS